VQKIRIGRELDKLHVEKIKTQLQKANGAGEGEVLFEISNRGGDHDAVFDLIEFLEREGFQTSCIVNRTASAASLLAISCKKRSIRKQGKMFLHAVHLTIPVTLISETGTLPRSTVQNSAYRQRQVEFLIKKKTRIPVSDIARIMVPGETGRFNAEEAKAWGLVDEILEY